jgi:transketolase C-terminal domain/subunit
MEYVALKGYAQSGKPNELLARYGLTSKDIEASVRKVVARKEGLINI